MVSLGHKTGLMNIQHMILYDFAKIGRTWYIYLAVCEIPEFYEKFCRNSLMTTKFV